MDDDDDDGAVSLVIHNGSATVQAGWCDSDAPRAVFPNVYAKKPKSIMVMMTQTDYCVGDEAASHRDFLKLMYPVEHGIVTNWDQMEKIWRHTFYNELRVDPEDYPVLLTEPPLNPKASRERMVKVMFDTFGVPKLHVGMSSALALLSVGRSTGVVLDIGHTRSYALPIVESCACVGAMTTVDVGGRDLTTFLVKLMKESSYDFTTPTEIEIVEDMKRHYCYVALDFQKEMKKANDTNKCMQYYDLPNGDSFPCNSQRFRCPEALFHPAMLKNRSANAPNQDAKNLAVATGVHWKSCKSIHEKLSAQDQPGLLAMDKGILHVIFRFLKENDSGISDAVVEAIESFSGKDDIKNELRKSVVIVGGSSVFPNIDERLRQELMRCGGEWKVICPPERKYSSWIGGQLRATGKDTSWLTKGEYKDNGPSAIHSKCP